MLSLKYIIRHSSQKMCSVKCSVTNLMGKQKPLQVRVKEWILQRKNRASCFASCQASITVETSLAFPIFLCAFVCITGLAQMVLIDMEVHHAVSQTAKVYAKQQVVRSISDRGQESGGNIFLSIYDGSAMCETMIEGGRKGIKISSSTSSGEEVRLRAEYILKMPVPFFSGIRFRRSTAVKRRIFSGYVKHWGEQDDLSDNQIVYVAENGVVYHKNSSCSHICLKITGNAAIQEILHSSKYTACEKCIHNSGNLSALFVTAYGDCYHSTLGCSGLKRTIRAVKLRDVRGLRPCSRCTAGK